MGSPSTSLATLRPDLGASFEEFSLEADRHGFIGHRVFPVFDTMKQSGPFGRIPVEQLLQHPETKRAPGSGYNRREWNFITDSYATEEHGIEEPIDDREAEMYREYFDVEQISAQRAMDSVLRAAELRIATAVFNATTYASQTTAITNEWDDSANAVPLTDVEAAVQLVWTQCGMWPNALIVNRKVYRNLRNVAQIVERVKYQGFMDARAGNITEQALSDAFDLRFIVAGGTQNTANEAVDAVFSQIWSDEYAMVARIVTSRDIREPGLGRTFHWAGDGSAAEGRVESYRDETVRSDIIRVRHDVDEKDLYVECGHLLSNVTT